MMQVCPEPQLSLRLDVISSSLNLQTLIFSGDDNMSDTFSAAKLMSAIINS